MTVAALLTNQKMHLGNSLAIQRLGLCASTAGGLGTKSPQAMVQPKKTKTLGRTQAAKALEHMSQWGELSLRHQHV